VILLLSDIFSVIVMLLMIYNQCLLLITYLVPIFLAGEPVDFMKDVTGVFEASDEWKTVEPGKLCLIFLMYYGF